MTVWVVRSGRYGETEDLTFEKGLAVIGWEDVPDLSTIESRTKLLTLA